MSATTDAATVVSRGVIGQEVGTYGHGPPGRPGIAWGHQQARCSTPIGRRPHEDHPRRIHFRHDRSDRDAARRDVADGVETSRERDLPHDLPIALYGNRGTFW